MKAMHPRKRAIKRKKTKLPRKRINRRKLKFRRVSRRQVRAGIQKASRAAQRGKTHRPTAAVIL